MSKEYPKEELQKIYELLPEELKETIFSNKIAEDIYNVCLKNGLEEKNIEVAKVVGYVLLGLLPPNEFEKTIKEEITLESKVAKRISQEIYHLVFFPLKNSLERIYKIEMIEMPVIHSEEKTKQPEKLKIEETSIKRTIQDIYREPIE